MTIEFTANLRPFSGHGKARHSVSVDLKQDIVRVWDDLAQHYTTCHSLSQSSQKRLIELAEMLKHLRKEG